jgi:predicted ATPase
MSGSQAIMGQVSMPQFTHMRAEVLLHGGNDDLALELVCTALAQAEAHQDHYYSAELYRLRACCHRARGEAGAASAAIRQALTLARTHGAALFELRAALALAGWDPDEGRSAVQEALATLPQPIAWLETTAARRLLTAGETARHNS